MVSGNNRDYSELVEKWVRKDFVRRFLGYLCAERRGTARPYLEEALVSYGNPNAQLHHKVAYWLIHKLIDKMRSSASRAEVAAKLSGHPPTLRGIISTARSVAHFGLTTPQKWLNPLFVVWNFTNRCNLHCRHCYQSSGPDDKTDELSLAEKLSVVDELGRNYVAMVAFAGGEPTLSPHLEPVLARCQKYGMHTTLATHGGLLTRARCERLAGLGVRYVEVSLDSVDPARHDRFRGVEGMWQKSVEGIKNVVATEGMRAGIAMCVTRENLYEVEPMIRFAIELGVSCFAHFNFIPVGRGVEMANMDITPRQREELIATLYKWMQKKQIGVISTAPQLARYCMMHSGDDGLISVSHAGNAPGGKARIIAKYLGGCGAGRTYACLEPEGSVTPCVYMPERIMGNVRNRSFEEIFRGSPWWDLLANRDAREGNCGSCEFRFYCGGCRARADAYFNRLDQSDVGCIYNEDLWEKITIGN